MVFENKNHLIQYVKEQFNITLKNEPGFLNEDEDLLYTEIPKQFKNAILSHFDKVGIEHNEHIGNNYWIYLKN